MVLPGLAGKGMAGQEGMSFSDEDLKRYRKPSDQGINKVVTPSGDERKAPAATEPAEAGKKKGRRIEVPYKAFEGRARRIIIPVTFNNSVTAPMALDTGSPGMLISFQLAEKLNLIGREGRNLITAAAGIGGTAPAILTIVDSVQVGDARDSFIPTTVTASISESFEGLIGLDFMANYSIEIDTQRRMVVFEELPPRPNMPAGHDETWWRINFHDFSTMREQWKAFRDMFARRSSEVGGRPKTLSEIEDMKALGRFSDRQYEEADRLFSRLHKYAAEHSVPMEWRKY